MKNYGTRNYKVGMKTTTISKEKLLKARQKTTEKYAYCTLRRELFHIINNEEIPKCHKKYMCEPRFMYAVDWILRKIYHKKDLGICGDSKPPSPCSTDEVDKMSIEYITD